MYLMGQSFFSADIMIRFHPRSILAIAVCRKDDCVMRPILESYASMRVVICPASERPPD